MIRHYASSALRNFRRRPLNTAIKLLALSLGLACLLTAHVIGDYFRQADGNWARADRTYVIAQETERPGGGWNNVLQGAAPVVAKYLRADFPQLETVARMYLASMQIQRDGADQAWRGLYVDPEFTDVFDLEMTAGRAALDRPHTVLISQTAARAMFGDEDPIGQTVTVTMQALGATALDATVRGVFEDVPANSHLGAAGQSNLHVFGTLDLWRDLYIAVSGPGAQLWWELDSFVSSNFVTYAVLPEDGSLTAEALDRGLVDFAARRAPPELRPGNLDLRFRAVPMTSLSSLWFERRHGAPFGLSLVSMLYALGALTLVIGCVNFTNLSAAEAVGRGREIGLRKAVGARRRQVAAQMLVEVAILVVAALALTVPLSGLIAGAMAARFDIPLALPDASRIDYWGSVALIAIAVAAAASLYPAAVLASFRPARVMRAASARGGSPLVRTCLVGAQFAAAGFLTILVIVMLTQSANLQRLSMRQGADPIVSLPSPVGAGSFNEAVSLAESISQRLLASPSVVGVTFMDAPPFYSDDASASEFAQSLDPGAARFPGQSRSVGFGYFELTDAALLAGRTFSRERNENLSVVIDAGTAEMMGYTPQEAVGQSIYRLAGRSTPAGNPNPPAFTVIGVVQHAPLELAAAGPSNFVYIVTPYLLNYTMIRLRQGAGEAGVAHIRQVWSQIDGAGQAFPIFIDQSFDARYRPFRAATGVATALSVIAVAIAAMGLFGLASLVVQRRVREVGVRKTLGAGAGDVMRLLLWDFSKPVVLANLIAWPFAFLAARAYLRMFVTPAPLTPLPFLGALAFTLLIAWLAVGAHAWRAASVKPANVLKYE